MKSPTSNLSCPCAKSLMPSGIPSSLISELTRVFKKRETLTFRPGQVLFHAGHHPFGLFIIEKGELELKKDDSQVLIRSATDADPFIGFNHLIYGEPYCSTGSALTEVEVKFLPRTLLEEYIPAILCLQ